MQDLLRQVYIITRDNIRFLLGSLFLKLHKIDITVYSIERTLSIAKFFSIIRFGDGEIALINGKSIVYQEYSDSLAQELNQILQNSKNRKVLVCLPDIFSGMKQLNFLDRFFHTKFLYTFRCFFIKYCNGKEFGNTFMSRPYIIFKDKTQCSANFLKIRSIWNNRDIVIVEGETSRSGVGNELFNNAKSIKRVICPAKNAYSLKKQIINAIRCLDKNFLYLFALGPTAKVVIYELSAYGFHSIDIGHLDSEFEWYNMGSKKKVLIKGKHTAEMSDDNAIPSIDDTDYLSQIVLRIQQ